MTVEWLSISESHVHRLPGVAFHTDLPRTGPAVYVKRSATAESTVSVRPVPTVRGGDQQ